MKSQSHIYQASQFPKTNVPKPPGKWVDPLWAFNSLKNLIQIKRWFGWWQISLYTICPRPPLQRVNENHYLLIWIPGNVYLKSQERFDILSFGIMCGSGLYKTTPEVWILHSAVIIRKIQFWEDLLPLIHPLFLGSALLVFTCKTHSNLGLSVLNLLSNFFEIQFKLGLGNHVW